MIMVFVRLLLCNRFRLVIPIPLIFFASRRRNLFSAWGSEERFILKATKRFRTQYEKRPAVEGVIM